MKIMELEDLKSDWQNGLIAEKSEDDLQKMTRITNHPTLKRIRTKLIIETISFVLFLVVYYDWFDGDKKPFYANAFLVVSLLFFIANDVVGYFSIEKRIEGSNLKTSLEKYLSKIKQLSTLSLICTFLYSISIVVFFTSVIHFTREKSFILVGISIIFIQLMFWSQRIWIRWIKKLEQQVIDFKPDEI